jgi:DNA polymerase-3 subunit gamma/tau
MNSPANPSGSYQALARRYRPRFFRDFVGLEHVTRTLQNAIRQGRVGHAYLFCGPRGIGKTSMVRVFAMALNCEKGPAEEPCGKCDSCTRIHRGDDIDVIEIDGASHTGVDNIRELRSNAIYSPARSRYKIYAIDEVHMLSKPAFNALLKTLEEPPEHVKFLFATTEPQKVLETIQSRCQRFDFPRISARDITETLKRICANEKIKASDKILGYIARNVRGGLRDALSILDQVIAYCGEAVEDEAVYRIMGSVPEETLREMASYFAEADTPSALKTIDALFNAGKDPGEVLDALSNYLRDLMVLKTCEGDSGLLITTAEPDETMRGQAARFPADALLYMLQILGETRSKLRFIENQQVLLEVAMVRLARWAEFESFDEILSRLAASGGVAAGLKEQGNPSPGRRNGDSHGANHVRASDAKPSTPDNHGGADSSNPPAARAEAGTAISEREPSAEELSQAEASTADDDPKFAFAETSPVETWSKAIDQMYDRRGLLAAALAHGQLISFDGENVLLGFLPDARFFMEQLQDPAKRREAESNLGEIIGRKISLRFKEVEPAPEEEPSRRAPAERPSHKSGVPPIVKKAMEMFKGELTD